MIEDDASEMTSNSKPAAVTTGEQIALLIRA
jgi:hypothetical protein